MTKKDIRLFAVLIFVICFTVTFIGYLVRYPGIYFVDSLMQLDQSIIGVYDDWHPLFNTLIVYCIPYKVLGIWSIVFLQIVWFSLAMAYFIATIRWYGVSKKLCIIIFAVTMLQPDTIHMAIFAMKDTTFAILTCLLMTNLVHMVCTKGEWLKGKLNLTFEIILITVCLFTRHNAILYLAPYVIAVVIICKKNVKQNIIMCATVTILAIIIKYPLYNSFHMEPTGGRVMETTGMCMVMMGNAIYENPDMVSEEVRDFMYTIQPEESWQTWYELGDWNYVKWQEEEIPYYYMDEVGAKKVLRYTANTISRCPDQTIRAFFALTGMVWKVDGEVSWKHMMQWFDTNYEGLDYERSYAAKALKKVKKESALSEYIHDVYLQYRDIVDKSVLKYVFSYVGLLNGIIIITCFSKIKDKSNLKLLLYVLPVLMYNYGTALLLSGYDIRFFYYTYLQFFMVMFLLLRKDKMADIEGETHEEK